MPKGKNYAPYESERLMARILEVAPQNSIDWENICNAHNQEFPGQNRDVVSIKRKYAEFHRQRVPTGSPHMPEHIRLAKLAHRAVADRAHLTIGRENNDQLVLNNTSSEEEVPSADDADADPSAADDDAEESDIGLSVEEYRAQRAHQHGLDASGRRLIPREQGLRELGVNPNQANRIQDRTQTQANPTQAAKANRTTTSTIAVPRRSPARNNGKTQTANDMMQVMMMDMQQRQLQYQENMVNMQRDREESRAMMATAIQAIAQVVTQAFQNHSD